MAIQPEVPITEQAPDDVLLRQTVARVRVHDTDRPEVMALGFNSLAVAFLDLGLVSKYLKGELPGYEPEDVHTELLDDTEPPYVSHSIEVTPPLNSVLLHQLGDKLIGGAFNLEDTTVAPEGVLFIDNRGNNTPISPVARDGEVLGQVRLRPNGAGTYLG